MRTPVLAAVSIALSVIAQLLLKLGANRALKSGGAPPALALERAWQIVIEPLTQIGLCAYVASAATWLLVISEWDVSKAYPLVGAGFLLVLAAGWVAGETIAPSRLAGVILIALGVALVGRS